MISQEKFNLIKKKYGKYASWAIWANEGNRLKDHVGDLLIFDSKKNTKLLSELKPSVIFVGLNISEPVKEPFANFHSNSGRAHDYKIRDVLKGSPFWGAYMTDIIKGLVKKESDEVLKYLKAHKHAEEESVKHFLKEIDDLGGKNPKIIAIGDAAEDVLKRNGFMVLKIPHYSRAMTKEEYQKKVRSILRLT